MAAAFLLPSVSDKNCYVRDNKVPVPRCVSLQESEKLEYLNLCGTGVCLLVFWCLWMTFQLRIKGPRVDIDSRPDHAQCLFLQSG